MAKTTMSGPTPVSRPSKEEQEAGAMPRDATTTALPPVRSSVVAVASATQTVAADGCSRWNSRKCSTRSWTRYVDAMTTRQRMRSGSNIHGGVQLEVDNERYEKWAGWLGFIWRDLVHMPLMPAGGSKIVSFITMSGFPFQNHASSRSWPTRRVDPPPATSKC